MAEDDTLLVRLNRLAFEQQRMGNIDGFSTAGPDTTGFTVSIWESRGGEHSLTEIRADSEDEAVKLAGLAMRLNPNVNVSVMRREVITIRPTPKGTEGLG
jgi:hypothetical protein